MHERSTFEQWVGVALRWWVAVVVILLMDRAGAFGWFRGGVERVLFASQREVQAVRRVFQRPVEAVGFWFEGSRVVVDLEERLQRALVERAELIELREENQYLREQLSLGRDVGTYQMAQLLVGPTGVRIDLGETDGTREGQVVVRDERQLIGVVSRVGLYTSELSTPAMMGSRVAVGVLNGVAEGVVVGMGGNVQLQEVLQTDPLSEGATLVTTGVDGVYPPGLVVGSVTRVLQDEAGVTKRAEVSLPSLSDGFVWVVE